MLRFRVFNSVIGYFLMLFFFFDREVFCQNVVSIGSEVHYGFIIPHTIEVHNTKGSRPFGSLFLVNFIDTSQKIVNLCHCIKNNGLNIGVFNYDNKVLGYGLGLNYFLEPQFWLSKKWLFVTRGLIGIMYQTNPYHNLLNPTNASYSTYFNFFLGLSGGLKFLSRSQWALSMYSNFLHTSNGGVKEPNKGINWPTFNFQVEYFLRGKLHYIERRDSLLVLNKLKAMDWYIFYSNRIIKVGDKKRYHLWGIGMQYIKQVSKISSLLIGGEGYFDYALHHRLQVDSVKSGDGFRAGILIGHAFVLGKFYFGQQIGYYVYENNPYYDKIYHRWTLVFSAKRWVVGIGLKAHRHIANFGDIKIGYRILK